MRGGKSARAHARARVAQQARHTAARGEERSKQQRRAGQTAGSTCVYDREAAAAQSHGSGPSRWLSPPEALVPNQQTPAVCAENKNDLGAQAQRRHERERGRPTECMCRPAHRAVSGRFSLLVHAAEQLQCRHAAHTHTHTHTRTHTYTHTGVNVWLLARLLSASSQRAAVPRHLRGGRDRTHPQRPSVSPGFLAESRPARCHAHGAAGPHADASPS